jgi:DNA-binding winged helix-turn-helix (wHTH) protein
MEASQQSGRAVRFGTFELDLAAGELHKNGLKVRLQDQPFQLLAALVARPGEVVTREELKEKLWPADTSVDFDRSLNTAASKLREALGDSASSPRFIETLPRRGYRFLASVEIVGDTPTPPVQPLPKPEVEQSGPIPQETHTLGQLRLARRCQPACALEAHPRLVCRQDRVWFRLVRLGSPVVLAGFPLPRIYRRLLA